MAQAMWSRILPADSWARFWWKLLLRETALVSALVALAGPRFGTQVEAVMPRGSDLYVLIDVSRSMLAEDVPPSRLGRAKADVAALVNRLDGERLGLIAFAGQAVVKCPLTVDYDAFRRSLDELDPSSTARGHGNRRCHSQGPRSFSGPLGPRSGDLALHRRRRPAVVPPRGRGGVRRARRDDLYRRPRRCQPGARIPQSGQAKSYVEYDGHQVWSKLDGTLLKEIALKTSGVYVPVETRAYDLGELYVKYLQGRHGTAEQSQKRVRRAEQFQIFLALAVLALLADAFIRPYPGDTSPKRQRGIPSALASAASADTSPKRQRGTKSSLATQTAASLLSALVLVVSIAGATRADNPAEAVRDGMRLYGKGEFDKARDKFAAASEQFASRDAVKAAIAAFDQACALHRKGDVAAAREAYLKAGLAHDKKLAASAHFNLGTLAAEEARRLAGEQPESVPPDKRQEILDQLRAAVASFRHCLEMQPDNAHARRDIELVRQWIKYYNDQWQAHDREKRRQEMNLVAFLEFLIETQRALKESSKDLAAAGTAPADAYAEPKRLQEELQQEIAPLKEKIQSELTPKEPAAAGAAQAPSKELEQGIALLQGWADGAGQHMLSAARRLGERQAGQAAELQQSAIDELDKIWDAVIPFHALLARDLTDQTQIAESLAPAAAADEKPKAGEPSDLKVPQQDASKPAPQPQPAAAGSRSLTSAGEDLATVAETQERTERRTRLLKLKAEAELARLEKSGPADAKEKGHEPASKKKDAHDAAGAQPPAVDPAQVKAGYQKAIDLAPRTVEQMERAVKSLKNKDRQAAHPPAEEARKLLEEIQKAQPKKDPEDQKKQEQDQNQKKNEEQKKDQNEQQKKDQQKQEQQKKDEQQKDQRKKDDEQKKEQEKKKQQEPKKSAQEKQEQKKNEEQQASRDRVEDMLRRVRERQQEKRERDRTMKARVYGRVAVEKDW